MNLKSIRIGAVLLALVIAMVFNGLALWNYYSYLKEEKVLKREKQQLMVLRENIAQAKNDLQDFEAEKKRLEGVLFNERDIPTFLDEVSKNAKQESVHIVSMRTKRFHQVQLPKDVKKRRNHVLNSKNKNKDEALKKIEKLERIVTLSALPIDIKLKGKFSSLVGFLNRLEAHKQLTNVSDVQIDRGRDYPQIECRFTLRIYSLKSLSEYKL